MWFITEKLMLAFIHFPIDQSQVFDTSNFIDSLYTWSAFNTEGVGKIIGGAIVELSNVVDVEGIHLIGKLDEKLLKN